jgi:Delta3,5-Delta2,4-dienoyl-CoA isomerase
VNMICLSCSCPGLNLWLTISEIADKSAWAVMGTKAVLLRSRDATIEQGLEHVATWNAGMMRSNDLKEAIRAFLEKRKPVFSKL